MGCSQIDQHLVMVKPMNDTEIKEAIQKPAALVGLQVQDSLVQMMTKDVVESPGSLPLLQYTLTELWKEAQTGSNSDRLMHDSYNRLGGIEKTLQKRANEVYNSLKEEEKPVAKRIFLELTQLGETSDTRRQVRKEGLKNQQHSLELLDRVIEQLVKEKLITTDESKSQNATPGVILDIVHESLIRHWQELRQWVKENQVALEIERRIEARAEEWKNKGKTEDPGLLLQGAMLTEAEAFLEEYSDLGILDGIAEEFIKASQKVRDRLLKQEQHQALVLMLALADSIKQATIAGLGEQAALARLEKPVDGLIMAIKLTGESKDKLKRVLGSVQTTLFDLLKKPIESNILLKEHKNVTSVAFSPDGEERIVLTFDLDFGDLLAVSSAPLPSVIIFRLQTTLLTHRVYPSDLRRAHLVV